MKAHVRNYFKHFDIGMEDVVYCENCGKKSMRGLIKEDNGAEWTDAMVRKYLQECLAKGWKLLPVGKECEGYSHITGCPGHEIKEK